MAPEGRRRSTRTKSRLSYVEQYADMDEELDNKVMHADDDDQDSDDNFRLSKGHGTDDGYEDQDADEDEPGAEDVARDAFGSNQPQRNRPKQDAAAIKHDDEVQTLIYNRPYLRDLAYQLAHPPRKYIKFNSRANQMKLERAWMRTKFPDEFRANNSHACISGSISLTARKHRNNSNVPHLNLSRDFVDWLEPVKANPPHRPVPEPLTIDQRQEVRCDERFGEHDHANGADGRSIACKQDGHNKEPYFTSNYEFNHEFKYCQACSTNQPTHLSEKALRGLNEGALIPLCRRCAVHEVDTCGFAYNSCRCNLDTLCFEHRQAHLESLTDKLDAWCETRKVKSEALFRGKPLDIDTAQCRCGNPPVPLGLPFAFFCVACEGVVILPRSEEEPWKPEQCAQKYVTDLGIPDYRRFFGDDREELAHINSLPLSNNTIPAASACNASASSETKVVPATQFPQAKSASSETEVIPATQSLKADPAVEDEDEPTHYNDASANAMQLDSADDLPSLPTYQQANDREMPDAQPITFNHHSAPKRKRGADYEAKELHSEKRRRRSRETLDVQELRSSFRSSLRISDHGDDEGQGPTSDGAPVKRMHVVEEDDEEENEDDEKQQGLGVEDDEEEFED